jgi:hypothetical protein
MKSVQIEQSRFSFPDNWDYSAELFFRANKIECDYVSLENKETNKIMGTKEDGRGGGCDVA